MIPTKDCVPSLHPLFRSACEGETERSTPQMVCVAPERPVNDDSRTITAEMFRQEIVQDLIDDLIEFTDSVPAEALMGVRLLRNGEVFCRGCKGFDGWEFYISVPPVVESDGNDDR